MAQSNIDKTRIDNLERVIFQSKPTSNIPSRGTDDNNITLLAVMPNNKEMEDSLQYKKKTL
jgi:hypothetical protein